MGNVHEGEEDITEEEVGRAKLQLEMEQSGCVGGVSGEVTKSGGIAPAEYDR